MDYTSQNKKLIDGALKRAITRIDERLDKGLRKLCAAGMEYSLDEHDPAHPNHTVAEEGYGWVVLHNGVELERKIEALPGPPYSSVSRLLTEGKSECPSGRCGMVMASMIPPGYYKLKWEIKFQRAAIKDMIDFGDIEKAFGAK